MSLFMGENLKEPKKSFKSAVKAANIKEIRMHDMRHRFGTRLANNGADRKVIQDLLGHTDPKMTDRYIQVSNEFLKRNISKLTLDSIIGDLLETPGSF